MKVKIVCTYYIIITRTYVLHECKQVVSNYISPTSVRVDSELEKSNLLELHDNSDDNIDHHILPEK